MDELKNPGTHKTKFAINYELKKKKKMDKFFEIIASQWNKHKIAETKLNRPYVPDIENEDCVKGSEAW